tara:strand:+ start:3304 stop:4245 length:942 start_codon:yes stop_codon:yes gene_type:complete
MVRDNAIKQVKIETNSRLHLGFMNINSSSPYSYGGLGVSIDNYPTVINISKSNKFESNLPKQYTNKILNYINKAGLKKTVKINCTNKPNSHIGLGSGTQLILSLEEGLSKFYNLDGKIDIFNRNFRSGVGFNAYKFGGFIIDSPKKELSTSELIFKSKFPKNWKVIVLFDNTKRGLHGASENKFFTKSNTNSIRKYLSDITLNELIPSIIYKDFDIFAKSLTEFQKCNASLYSSIQKSIYLSNDIAKIIKKVSSSFKVGCGQSSWGPTSYMFIDSKKDLKEILPILDKAISMYNNLSYDVVSARNSGRKLTYT